MFLLMGSHLFNEKLLENFKNRPLVMIEDPDFFTHFRYHQQKIRFIIDAMRNHRDALKHHGFDVLYYELERTPPHSSFATKLKDALAKKPTKKLFSFSIEDKFFRERLHSFCQEESIEWEIYPSPLFLKSEKEIDALIPLKKPLMRNFYETMRIKENILLTKDKKPQGGKFSFDEENREKLPKGITVPPLPISTQSPHFMAVTQLVVNLFGHHPGSLSAHWLPSTRQEALLWLEDFLNQRFQNFGPYEDAIDAKHPFLFHSVISPLMNIGLITPKEVVTKALKEAQKGSVPLSSVEGFVRQIIGWREFVRGIYEKFSDTHESTNFFHHQRTFTDSWYEGTTGITPLDDAIQKAWNLGYCHHIERLMIISNLMLLTEIHPLEVHRWFMEMFVDSADWVMGPNVFGMGQFSDGGIFTTKPYICGSNYLLKMSHYKKEGWCDVVDGLYWRFIHKHRDFFQTQARSSMMPKMLDKIDAQRKTYLFSLAEDFIAKNTRKYST